MTNAEVESWALRVIDSVVRKGPSEWDERVELKSNIPEPSSSIARRIAGHANAARGALILWMFGVDEKGGNILGTTSFDLASWWPQVAKHFQSLAPEPRFLTVAHENMQVPLILMQTDRAPYLVANPAFGSKGDPVEFEVPWRANTSTRTARREDLLRILVPAIAVPDYETKALRACVLKDNRTDIIEVVVTGTGYLSYLGSGPIYVPDHRASGVIVHPGGPRMPIVAAQLLPKRGTSSTGAHHNFDRTDEELTVRGPGSVGIAAKGELHRVPRTAGEAPDFSFDDFSLSTSVTIELRFGVLGAEVPIVVQGRLAPATARDAERCAWEWRPEISPRQGRA